MTNETTFEDGTPYTISADGIIKLADELLVDIGRAQMLNEITAREIEVLDERETKRNGNDRVVTK